MMPTFKLAIVSPAKKIFGGEIDKVTLPGEEGRIGILCGHAPFLAALAKGTINVTSAREEKTFNIESGFVEANEKGVTVLVN